MPGHRLMEIVAAESTPEKDAAFEKWYTGQHIPMLFEAPQVKQISRYRRKGSDEKQSKYMTVYEFDSEADMAAFQQSEPFGRAIRDFEANKEKLAFNLRWTAVYELIKTWHK